MWQGQGAREQVTGCSCEVPAGQYQSSPLAQSDSVLQAGPTLSHTQPGNLPPHPPAVVSTGGQGQMEGHVILQKVDIIYASL